MLSKIRIICNTIELCVIWFALGMICMSLYTKTDLPIVWFIIIEGLFCICMVLDTLLITKEKKEEKNKIAEEVKEEEKTK